nr:ribonuclease H-like domain, reverse transcriptase, RNA-dependent DNA polymerase [Tanacetum cinerariifolium]
MICLYFEWRRSGLEKFQAKYYCNAATEAEYIAASEAAMEVVWIRKFISGLGIVPTINEPINIFCDNSVALHFANEPEVREAPDTTIGDIIMFARAEWEFKQRLPKDNEKIMKMIEHRESQEITKKDLYSIFSSGIRLNNGKVWLSLSEDRKVKEMISATTFSYEHCLTASGTLNSCIAERRDGEWMIIELCRFRSHNQIIDFEVQLKSFCRHPCGNGPIFLDGIEFRPIDNVSPNNIRIEEKEKDQKVPKETNSQKKQKGGGHIIAKGTQGLLNPNRDMTKDSGDSSKKEFSTTSTPQFQCPMLKPSNYSLWAIQMQIILEANGLWEMIEPNEKTQADNKKDKTTIAFLYQALPEEQLLQITKHKTAKAIWDALKTRHIGEERVQQARLQTLKSDFEMLHMKEDETIDTFTGKLTTLVNKAANNQEKLMFTRHENKGKYFRGRGHGKHRFSQRRNHENFKEDKKDEETSHFNKNNFKKSNYDTSKLQCYKCKKIGHIAPKCPQRTNSNKKSNLVEEDLEPTLLMSILEDEEQKVSLHKEDLGYKETNKDSLDVKFKENETWDWKEYMNEHINDEPEWTDFKIGNLEVTNEHHDQGIQPIEEDNEFPNNDDDDYASPTRDSTTHSQTSHTPSTRSSEVNSQVTPNISTQSNYQSDNVSIQTTNSPSHFDHTPEVHHLDVKSAFLHGDLKEEVYVTQPKGFIKKQDQGKVYRLIKALYGLRQALRAWNIKLHNTLKSLDFKKCALEQAIYTKTSKDSILLIGVYVDDLIITGTPKKEIDKFKAPMEEKFKMSDLGLLAYYLGIEVTQTNGDISIKQSAYANKILKEARMLDCNETLIPMDPRTRLTKVTEGTMVNSTEYQSIIGCLRYLLHTRPDLSYSVGLLSRFMQEPREQHMKDIRQVLHYVKGTKDHGITYKHNGGNKIHGYIDSSYGVNTQEGKGTTGIIFYYGESPIRWSTQKQATVALSSCESEFIAATTAATQALWLKRLLSKLTHSEEDKVTIRVDNKSAIAHMKNLVFHERSKHIDTKYHFIRECVEREDIQVEFAYLLSPLAYGHPILQMDHEESVDKLMTAESSVNRDQQLPNDFQEIMTSGTPCGWGLMKLVLYNEQLFSLSKLNCKKCHMLSAKAVINKSPDAKFTKCPSSTMSRFEEVVELRRHQAFSISCNIETKLLSPDISYACYLVLQLPESSEGLKCPVKALDLRNKNNKETTIIYLRAPCPIDLYRDKRVPIK